eukprot:gene12456-12592_t
MPHKAQFLLQLAQAAARAESRQQLVLPQVAVNVWDTLTGNHAGEVQHVAGVGGAGVAQQQGSALHSYQGNGMGSSLGVMGYNGASRSLEQDMYAQLYPPHLLAACGLAPPHWNNQPQWAASLAANAAALSDSANASQQLLHIGGVPSVLLATSGMTHPGRGAPLPSSAAAGAADPGADRRSNSSTSAPLLGGRKPRFSNSISLNKQIMNTHSMRELHTMVRSKGSMFDFFNISSAIARVPKLVGPAGGVQNDVTAKALVDDLAQLMAANINSFDARGLANSAWAFGKLKYAPSHQLPALIAAAAVDKIEAFSAQNMSNLLWSFVYLHYKDERLLNVVAEQAARKVEEFKPQELANVVWALASMEHYDRHLMDVVGQRALVLVDQFKEQELSNVVWAFAKLHHYDPELFGNLLTAVKAKLPHFLPQGVSNVAWALATAGHEDSGLFQRLLDHCMTDVASYDVQGLSNIMWACATLGHRDATFLAAATRECSDRIERMSSQNLSNALWACATLGYVDRHMLGIWADAVVHKVDMFEPQGLSNTAWAFAKMGFSTPLLFESLAEASLSKLDGFTAQGLSNTLWAFATVGHYHPGLVQQMAEQVMRGVSDFNAQNCSVSAWAFSTLRHYHPRLFDALLQQLAGQVQGVEPQNVANFLPAWFTYMSIPGTLVAAAQQLMPQMNQQELCNTAWALGVLGQLDANTWKYFCQCVGKVHGVTPEGLHQAFHAQLMLHSHLARAAGVPLSGCAPEHLPTLPEPLHRQAKEMWQTSAQDVRVSKLQEDVSVALLLAGIPNLMEWLTDDGLLSIDIAFQVDGQPVAVEVDGSHHYTNSIPQLPLSEVLIRRQLLQDRGWQVVNVGYLEWDSLPNEPTTRASALLQLVASVLPANSNWDNICLPERGADAVVGSKGNGISVSRAPSTTTMTAGADVRGTGVGSGALQQGSKAGLLGGDDALAAAAAAVSTAAGGGVNVDNVFTWNGSAATTGLYGTDQSMHVQGTAISTGLVGPSAHGFFELWSHGQTGAAVDGVAVGVPVTAMGLPFGQVWSSAGAPCKPDSGMPAECAVEMQPSLGNWVTGSQGKWDVMGLAHLLQQQHRQQQAAGMLDGAILLDKLAAQLQRQQLQQEVWEAMMAGAGASAAVSAAAPSSSMSPEQLTVGRPASNGVWYSSASTRSSNSGGSAAIDAPQSLPSTPGSAPGSKATASERGALAAGGFGGGPDGLVDAAGNERMRCFTWGDPFTSSIWGPVTSGAGAQ